MKKSLIAAAALVALPVMAQAQTLQYPGFYAGVEGGGNYMFNTTVNTAFGNPTVYPSIGYAFGGMVATTSLVRASRSKASIATRR